MLNVLSLGAGVQSTTLLLMSSVGELEPLNAAIFADTGWESHATYEHLDWLEREVDGRVPIVRVSQGNLRENALGLVSSNERKWGTMPLFTRYNGSVSMIGFRFCTTKYKVRPIRKAIRERLGKGEQAVLWLGISLDEVERMRDSGVQYYCHRYPLVERRMTRQHCLAWLAEHGYPEPPRSSCLGCPFHSNYEWRAIRSDPAAWADVTEFDRYIRQLPKVRGEVYLHRSLRPLTEVDLSTAEDHDQLRLWVNDCTGLCGT